MAPVFLPMRSLLLFLFFSSSLFGGAAPDDLASDRAALLAFRAAVFRDSHRWNTSDPSPCALDGVTCSDNRVTELRLPGADLYGRIPHGTLGNLTALTAVSLRYNLLYGTLPQDFTALVNLRLLHLQNNRFSGEIPPPIFALRQLVRLNLGGNLFHGVIPQDFSKLTNLYALLLDRNRLSGEIPDLRYPNLFLFNVSFNHLNGSIPSSLRGIPASSFIGNSLCGGPLAACPGDNSNLAAPALSPLGSTHISNKSGGKKKLSAGEISGFAIGAAVAFLILLLLLMVLCFRARKEGEAKPKEVRKLQPEAEMALRGKRDTPDKKTELPSVASSPLPVSGGANGVGRKLVFTGKVQRIYDLQDLLRASAEVLGKGTSGTTYKAMLEMGMVVAVKRLRDVSLSEKEFRERMDAIGAMDHPNLVALQAYYYSKDEKLLVYEVVPNGSLSSLLHGNKVSGREPLDWETRLEIALRSARGIEFIHLKGSGFSHGNIKSSNIILTKTYDACVSDFGLSSLGSVAMPDQRSVGYRAPEVTDVRKVSQKADVYSFGVLLMELLTAKSPTQTPHSDDSVDLPTWVRSVAAVNWRTEVFDVELLRDEKAEEAMMQLMQLAVDCAALVPNHRPSMSEVVARIEEIP
ncbi:probable inactive receptor kinase At1g48480 [Zingiber officinale]|uniref:probable inactive receptor kinase At1g48480 n=1 Tax=Zingiber officinale TaxID=94328 RepID=UPI001C4A9878|nr:probable inactive receptor kinase At1g48480 [Zingiber officinale]